MEILPKSPSTKGPAQMFTGDVWFDVIAKGATHVVVDLTDTTFIDSTRTGRWCAGRGDPFLLNAL